MSPQLLDISVIIHVLYDVAHVLPQDSGEPSEIIHSRDDAINEAMLQLVISSDTHRVSGTRVFFFFKRDSSPR